MQMAYWMADEDGLAQEALHSVEKSKMACRKCTGRKVITVSWRLRHGLERWEKMNERIYIDKDLLILPALLHAGV